MKVVVASDHGGFEYKEEVKKYLEKKGIEVLDVGCFSKESASWSEFGSKAAMKVAQKEADFGVVICRSGVGVCLAANKVKGAYCGLAYNDVVASSMKQHDHCNMIAFGADYVKLDEMLHRIDLFLEAIPEDGRHLERFKTLQKIEK